MVKGGGIRPPCPILGKNSLPRIGLKSSMELDCKVSYVYIPYKEIPFLFFLTFTHFLQNDLNLILIQGGQNFTPLKQKWPKSPSIRNYQKSRQEDQSLPTFIKNLFNISMQNWVLLSSNKLLTFFKNPIDFFGTTIHIHIILYG